MKPKLVHIGEGRIIEMVEEGTAVPSPEPRNKNRGKMEGSRPLSDMKRGAMSGKRPSGARQGLAKKVSTVPGYKEWLGSRAKQIFQFRGQTGFSQWSRSGIPDGMRKAKAQEAWSDARKKANKHMANMKKAGLIPDDEIVQKATMATLEIMESPMNQDMRLKAARQLLEWYKAKPVSKTEMTVNAAEAWLATLAEEPKAE